MIQHTVAFRLADVGELERFLGRARELGELPGVRDFEVLVQVGRKNEFTHALSMYFETRADYDGYNEHPVHLAFVNDVWIPDVAEFIELDYVADD